MKFFSLLGFLCALSASANDDTQFLDQAFRDQAVPPARAQLAPEEIFRRTRLVLDYFKVPAEPDFQSELNNFRFTTMPAQVAPILKALDQEKQFDRFFDAAGTSFQSFQDRDSKKVGEYRMGSGASPAPAPLSLRGLRVAIDPGHMGGDVWDKRTGKYVETSGGVRVSEGLINLQTSLLVEQRLRALGAEVLVTHRGLGPVSSLPYEKLDIHEYGQREVRARALEDWFQALLASSSESKLGENFKNASAVKKAFSEIMRGDYYAQRADLAARSALVAAFKPDLTLVIHFDASQKAPTPNAGNITRAYVPGSFMKTEFATGEARAHFLAHLGQGAQWYRSVQLAQSIVNEIGKNLNVTIPKSDLSGTTPVLPGVFARNLALTRQIAGSPIAYIECLTYGNLAEFNRLIKKDGGTLMIDGKAIAYSSRLAALADSITIGVVKYVDANSR
jgi:N-acetylmuramoyl-L-alanine amidase